MAPTTEQLDAIPSLGTLYARAAVGAVLPGAAGELPDRELCIRGVKVDRDHLAAYVAGVRLPALGRVAVHLRPRAQLPALGRAHGRPPVPVPAAGAGARRQPCRDPPPRHRDEALDLAVRTADLRPHRKGRQFDVVAEARVGDDLVWSSTSTYLRRGGDGDEDAIEADLPLEPPEEGAEGARWQVPADTGRRYAAVSGDRNPIHLSPLTSRLFGFSKPIAHGMWTAARAFAAIEDRVRADRCADAAVRQATAHAAARWRSPRRSGPTAGRSPSGTRAPVRHTSSAPSPRGDVCCRTSRGRRSAWSAANRPPSGDRTLRHRGASRLRPCGAAELSPPSTDRVRGPDGGVPSWPVRWTPRWRPLVQTGEVAARGSRQDDAQVAGGAPARRRDRP